MAVARHHRAARKILRKKHPPQRSNSAALHNAVRIIYRVCCLAGASNLIDEIRKELRVEGILAGIRRHDTAVLFDWLMTALSYQGVSNEVAADYMERRGRVRWGQINRRLTYNSEYVVGYALKSLPRRTASLDDVLLLNWGGSARRPDFLRETMRKFLGKDRTIWKYRPNKDQ